MDATQSVSQPPALFALGGRTFVILPPAPRDVLVTHNRMRALAEEKSISPLDYVVKKHSHLPPVAFAVAVAEAIKIGAGAPTPPDPVVIWDQYTTLDGVRWRVWYHVSRVLAEFTLDEVAKLVTEDNLFDAADALDRALNYKGIDPKGQTPESASGPTSS